MTHMSNDKFGRDPVDRHIREAAWWLVKLQHPNLSPRLLLRWSKWQDSAPNREAFDSLESLWRVIHSSADGINSASHPRKTLTSTYGSLDEWTAPQSRIAPASVTRPKAADRGAQLATLTKPEDQETPAHILERHRLLSEEAAYWYFVCIDDPSMLRSHRREFLTWMRRSPDNIAELFKIALLDDKLRRIELERRSVALTKSNIAELTTSGSPYVQHREIKEDSVKHKRTLSFKLAAFSASLVFGVALPFVAQHYMNSEQVVATGASQWHHMTLPDGTAVHVDARSKVEVEYTDEARLVHVYEGSAVFDVAKDPKRPFIATTHLVDAVAAGTRFGVSVDLGVTTTVSEGTVRVTGRGRINGTAVLVNAGEELRVLDSSLTSSQLAHVDAERELLWAKNGLLILDGLTVAEGVEKLNRRNRVQILVDSPTLGAKVVEFASVKVDSPETYAKVVAKYPGVKMILDREKGVIRLSE